MNFLKPSLRTGRILCAAMFIPKSENENQSSQTTLPKHDENDKSKSWDKVYKIFTTDEFGMVSPELSSIIQTTFFSALVGACYGGFIQSRDAYLEFIERNQATAFVNHFEAKKKLQDHVTISFAKGALKWSWRLALFSGLYVTFVTVMAAYRGKASLTDYTLGGIFSGSIYQMKMGLRGVIVGGSFGAVVGLFAGSLSITILKLTGTSLDDVNEWRYETYLTRQRQLDEAVAKSESTNLNTTLVQHHDNLIKGEKK